MSGLYPAPGPGPSDDDGDPERAGWHQGDQRGQLVAPGELEHVGGQQDRHTRAEHQQAGQSGGADGPACPPAQQARGPDWLEYADGSPIRPYYSGLPRDEADRLISDFNHRVLTQQPQRVLGAYVRDAGKLFALTRDGSPGDTPIARWQFQTTFPYYPPHASEAVVKTATGRYGGGTPSVWRPVAAFLRAYQLDGGYTPGPLLAVCALAALAGCAPLLRRRPDPRTRQLALACLLFFTSAGAVTLASDAFEFSWRYQLPALVTLVPAGALGTTVLIRTVRARREVQSGHAGY